MTATWWTALFVWACAATALGAVVALWADRRSRDRRDAAARRRPSRSRAEYRELGVSVVDGLVIRGTGACAGLVVDAGPSPAAATYTCSTADPRLRRRAVVRLRAGWVREESGLDLGRGWDRGG